VGPADPHPVPIGTSAGSIILLVGQALDVGQRLLQLRDDRSGDAAPGVEFAEEHQVFDLLRAFQPAPRPNRPGLVGQGVHVQRDQGLGPLGDRSFERPERRGDVVGRVDRLADVVRQRRQEEFLVVAPLVAGEFEDLGSPIR